MSTNIYPGSPSVAERIRSQSLVFKTLAKRIASTLRCGLPGVIMEFDPVTQYAKVQLTIGEYLNNLNGGKTLTRIPVIEDVLVMLPGDNSWFLTFPDLVNSECYVCFADMCVNDWSTNGIQKGADGKYVACKQEMIRRHDLSDGFAILAPRNQKRAIHNYSTTAVELRSADNNTKIALDGTGNIELKGNGQLKIDGMMGTVLSGTSTASPLCVPIKINGVQYYMRISTSP